MPRYSTKKGVLSTEARSKMDKKAEQEGKKVVFRRKKALWPINETSFADLKKRDRKKYLSEIRLLEKKFPGKSHRVLDWGCGKGRIIIDLARKFPGIEFIGFSRDAYPAVWQTAPENAKFFHTTKEALERHFRQQSKKGNRIHLVLSNYGLEHLPLNEFVSHLKKIHGSIEAGGKIITNPLLFSAPKKSRVAKLVNEAVGELKSAGYEPEFSSLGRPGKRFLVALKRVK